MSENNNKSTKDALEQILDGVKIIASQAADSAQKVANQAVDSATKAGKTVKEKIDNDPTISEAVNQVQEVAKKASQTVKETIGKFDSPEIKTFIQYSGKEISQKDMIETIAALYMEEGHEAGDIKQMELYVKPEEDVVYYVINGSETGKIQI